MQKTNIEWADMTWNPVSGCTKVSTGCKNCYAETIHKRFHKQLGEFNKITLHPEKLTEPLRYKKPKRIFINSMSDLFHEDVPTSFIDKVFLIMSQTPHHTFMILTKRPLRMLEYFLGACENLAEAIEKAKANTGIFFSVDERSADIAYRIRKGLPNVWVGVSVENQEQANQRIPTLLQVPAAVRFLSCEPMIGRVDIVQCLQDAFNDKKLPIKRWGSSCFEGIHWVIAGGESGHHARPMHPEWVSSLRDQCAIAGVPFFFKQWGVFQDGSDYVNQKSQNHIVLNNGDYSRWDNDDWMSFEKKYSVDIWNTLNARVMAKVGKKKAGNTLDGQQHLEFPNTQNS